MPNARHTEEENGNANAPNSAQLGTNEARKGVAPRLRSDALSIVATKLMIFVVPRTVDVSFGGIVGGPTAL